MRTPIVSIAILLSALPGRATTLYDQLRAFNPYWDRYAQRLDGIPTKDIHNDVDYVRAHLAEVLGVLSEAPTEPDRDQWASAGELLAVLADYARQGRFPINYHRHERTTGVHR